VVISAVDPAIGRARSRVLQPRPSARRSNYLFEESTPLYEFGYGLSYTTFRMD
jgi:hypothetical protein